MAYEADGYSGSGNSPFVVPNASVPNTVKADMLRRKMAETKDPAVQQELAYRIAIEERYAQDMAQAQTGVQQAAQGSGLDFGEGQTPEMQAAYGARKRLAREAAERYNAAANKDGSANVATLKDVMGWQY
jgi:hypothetical protein